MTILDILKAVEAGQDELLTGPAFDKRLNISRSTRHRWEKAGLLTPVLIPTADGEGKSKRYPWSQGRNLISATG